MRILLLAGALLLSSLAPVAEAKTTRTFSGGAPADVEKNAKRAGFDYPDGEMKCSSTQCTQRWAQE